MSGKREFGEIKGIGARLDELAVAIGFMSRLPVPFRNVPIARAAWGFPAAGALIGLISGGVLWGADAAGIPALAAAVLALAAGALATGALHEDGLADCADGFWGGTTPERRLEIMRDSRSGAFGVLALILVSALKAALIADMTVNYGGAITLTTLVAVHALARAWLPTVMHLVPTAGKTGLAAMAGQPTISVAIAAIVLGVAIAATALWGGSLQALIGVTVASAVAVAAVAALAHRKLKGINGDSLGGMEQMAEVAGLTALVMIGF